MERNSVFLTVRKYFLSFGVGVGLGILLWACGKEDQPEPPPVYGETDRTVLVYMAADNSLNSDGYSNIKAMLKGMQGVEGRLVIYFDSRNQPPCLLKIDGGRNCVLDTIEVYPEENSASPEVLARVVADTRRMFPSRSYGLILWSHGMSWLPEGFSFPRSFKVKKEQGEIPRTKYFGEDQNLGIGGGSAFMDIKDLQLALTGDFVFILFDACLMSSVEVLYELKDKAKYLIASPAEILAAGFPYDKILPWMVGGEEELKQVCKEFYDYYNNQKQYATVCLVKTEGLEGLARVVEEVLRGKKDEIASMKNTDVWFYPTINNEIPLIFYDLKEYIRKIATTEQYTAFCNELDKTVVYKLATKEFWKAQIPPEKYSGLSSYIPLQKWTDMNRYYYTLSWPRAVYSDL